MLTEEWGGVKGRDAGPPPTPIAAAAWGGRGGGEGGEALPTIFVVTPTYAR